MKKVLLVLMTALVLLTFFVSCKKGSFENTEAENEKEVAVNESASLVATTETVNSNSARDINPNVYPDIVSVQDPEGVFEVREDKDYMDLWCGTEHLLRFKAREFDAHTFSNGNHIFIGELNDNLHYGSNVCVFANEETHELIFLLKDGRFHNKRNLFFYEDDKAVCFLHGAWDDGVYAYEVSEFGEVKKLLVLSYGEYVEIFPAGEFGIYEITNSTIDSTVRYKIDVKNWSVEKQGTLYTLDPKAATNAQLAIEENLKQNFWSYKTLRNDEKEISIAKDYSVITVNGVKFASTSSIRGGIRFLSFNGEEYALVNSDKLCLLLKADNSVYFYGALPGLYTEDLGKPCAISASSELTEKSTVYAASNLNELAGNTPWVEGVDGLGVGEYIDMETPLAVGENYGAMGALVFWNGFISASNPNSYKNNARVKDIEISTPDGKVIATAELADSAAPQVVSLPSQEKKIRIKIVSVYEGEKWEDTCILAIQVVPYVTAWMYAL